MWFVFSGDADVKIDANALTGHREGVVVTVDIDGKFGNVGSWLGEGLPRGL
jgi:hypothetical protein